MGPRARCRTCCRRSQTPPLLPVIDLKLTLLQACGEPSSGLSVWSSPQRSEASVHPLNSDLPLPLTGACDQSCRSGVPWGLRASEQRVGSAPVPERSARSARPHGTASHAWEKPFPCLLPSPPRLCTSWNTHVSLVVPEQIQAHWV